MHLIRISIIHSMTFALCILATMAHAQNFSDIKTLRNAHWEIRTAFAKDTSNFSVAITNGSVVLAHLSSACSQGTLQNNQACLCIKRPNGALHEHIGHLDRLLHAHEVLFRHSLQHFEVIADGQLLSRSFAPESFKGTLRATARPDGTPCLKDVKYQRIEPIQFGDDFMRTEEEAQTLGLWQPMTGNWKIYSVMERIQANPAARIRPGKIPVADRSPNPFTLSGNSGENAEAFILTGLRHWNGYRIAATAKPALGASFGIVFSVRDDRNFWYCKWTLTSYGTRPAPFQIIQRIDGKDITRDTVYAQGRANNWTRLEVESIGRRIRAFIDGSQISELYSDTCTGGKIGLFTGGSQETHFDDIVVTSVQSLQLTSPQDIRTYAQSDACQDWTLTSSPDNHVALKPLKANAQLSFGDAAWKGQRAEVALRPEKAFGNGLSFGKAGFRTGPDGSLEASCTCKSGVLKLAITDNATGRSLQKLKLPWDKNAAPIHMALDTSIKGVVELWIDDTLALRHADENLLVNGPVSLFATDEKVTFENITFFAEHTRDWEQPVDITRFAEDPFMQGWASPRYVWLRTKDKGVFPQDFNFTGDIYGAFKLKTPIADTLNYTFGYDDSSSQDAYSLVTSVEEPSSTAQIRLTRGTKTLFNTTVHKLLQETRPGTQIIDEKIGARPRTPDTKCWGDITFHRDGYVFWLEYKGKTIAAAYDTHPLTGRSLRVHVPAPMDFIHIALEREHVKDYLFEKAEADFASQGRWEVTNRFACDPRWSFMNGESFGTAALTTKYDIAGDYTIECFAGMRMRQGELKENNSSYPRVGDINIAMQTAENDLFNGYNLIIQAWDPKWSETQTQFRKRGDIVAISDMELIPRGREHAPKARNIALDWDPGGRPVHGAWYALKIRKTGKHFHVLFDNQQVFSYTDNSPLPDFGRIALWTQHNSIVLARVKINYRALKIPSRLSEPPQNEFAAIDSLTVSPLRQSPVTQESLPADNGILSGIKPLNGDQSAEISTIAPNALLMKNCNAGGDFAVTLPASLNKDALATDIFEFDIAVSDDAKLNFYVIPENDTLPHVFVPLSGPPENGPKLINLGIPSITLLKRTAINGSHLMHVCIPLAALFRRAYPWYTGNTSAKHIVIGMLHEGYLNAGLNGNSSNAWAVLTNVVSYKTKYDTAHDACLEPVSPEDNGEWGLNPIEIALKCPEWSAPLLNTASLALNGTPCKLTPQNTSVKDGIIRILPVLDDTPEGEVTFAFSTMMTSNDTLKTTWSSRVNAKLDRTPPSPPVIQGCITYLSEPPPRPLNAALPENSFDTSYQLRVLPSGRPAVDVLAQVCGSRLELPMPIKSKDILRNPIMFFDACIPEDAHIDMKAVIGYAPVLFAMTDNSTKGATLYKKITGTVGDGQWHTLQANLFDAYCDLRPPPIYVRPEMTKLTFQDFGYVGTGPAVSYGISNVRFARLDTTLKPLTLSWTSQDLNTVPKCAYMWSHNPDTEPDGSQIAVGKSISTEKLPQGLSYLHVKACDANGNWSTTTHQPFIIDNTHPCVTDVVPSNGIKAAPQAIEAAFSPDARGIDLSNVQFTLNGVSKTLKGNCFSYNEKTKKLSLNLLRLSSAFSCSLDDSSEWRATLANIHNAVGTPVPDISWNWKLDFSLDRHPPKSPSIYVYTSCISQAYNSFEADSLFPRKPSPYSQIVTDETTASKCSEIKFQPNTPGFCRMSANPFDFNRLKAIDFDIKIFPHTQVTLLLRTENSSVSYDYSLNAAPTEKTIGRYKGVEDNAKWHHVHIDYTKDILENLPKSNKPINAVLIGCLLQDSHEQRFRLDNVAFIHDLPPVAPLTFSMFDETGISHVLAKNTTSQTDLSVKDISHSILDRREPYFLLFNSTNTHYINSQIMDGAGNATPVEHYAVSCSHPVQSRHDGNTLDDFDTHPWSLVSKSSKKSSGITFKPLASGKDKVLVLHLNGAKQNSALLCTPVASRRAGKTSHTYLADLHLSCPAVVHTQDELHDLTLSLAVLNGAKIILTESNSIKLKSADSWQRDIAFTLKDTTQIEKAEFLAFKITPNAKKRMTLTIDNVLPK